jgi:predicted carbohydrate-binding protein with CBM5 and CBM33 domain
MTLRRRLAVLAATVIAAPLVGVIVSASPASAHGWITSPPSRQEQCKTVASLNCGDIKYEPQSVEAAKGSRACNGGGSRFAELNDDNKGWRVTSIGSSTQFRWQNTAMHSTRDWQYYVDGNLHTTINGNNQQPPSVVTHTVSGLPGGRHKILAVWNIADTPMAFYACVDVNVGGGSTPPPTNPPPSGGCPAAWSSSTAYTGGQAVSYNGHKFTARYWTQGETPTATEWGPWQDNGAC